MIGRKQMGRIQVCVGSVAHEDCVFFCGTTHAYVQFFAMPTGVRTLDVFILGKTSTGDGQVVQSTFGCGHLYIYCVYLLTSLAHASLFVRCRSEWTHRVCSSNIALHEGTNWRRAFPGRPLFEKCARVCVVLPRTFFGEVSSTDKKKSEQNIFPVRVPS